MTRETKIGLLTGLGVIVLMGVLLSDYLGGSHPAQTAATLNNVGEELRLQNSSPQAQPMRPLADATPTLVGLPHGNQAPRNQTQAQAPASALAANSKPLAMSTPFTLSLPTRNLPMNAAVDAGKIRVQPDRRNADLVTSLPMAPEKTPTGEPLPPGAKIYAVVKGDSLGKIAHKFYRAAGHGELALILEANPKSLKTVASPLSVGQKLVIPAQPRPEKPEPAYVATLPVGSDTPLIHAPSSILRTPSLSAATGEKPGAVAMQTYKIQKGDSLEKIARKFLGSGGPNARAQLLDANNLEADATLKVGMALKIPRPQVALRDTSGR